MFEPARVETLELIDLAGHAPRVLAENLADMRRANRWAGGVTLSLAALDQLTRTDPPGSVLTILDVATGIADIPRAVAVWAAHRNLDARIIATDISPDILHIAQQTQQGIRDQGSGIRGQGSEPSDTNSAAGGRSSAVDRRSLLLFAAADGLALPLADASVDVAMCSFALHHLAPADAAALLREMRRVARRGVVVNDLVRWLPGYWATWLLTHALSRNPLTRHDGPLSVLRAYTRAEMRALAHDAGLRDVRLRSFLWYRAVMTGTR